ncbi:LacI family DNA-binding transcriptional regulator [Roseobacter litoralis]|uniref:HTH-type transcriptional regulator, LacI family n=1 Tax=Roseobacter litoralis (strain ATCC 49566 / DSM 6996 / JCM 21268 / NBRC 15278 / OCh 149) TaxID=391595 RepID=F7ZK43_ROSLO|nr:LacI family DNA-binding transcriptional regulator [Roseobacter litoralis]AEI92666.1 HTH-type transcriptional regulator, LacI family [Roseobacter litoralis Och 149]
MVKSTAPTLEDVAKMAGVSTASISRALNDPDKVAASTREKIEKAIETLGYTPNFGGRALASSRTNTVGAVIPSMANAMFASGLQAFQEALAVDGVTLLVATTGFDSEQEFRQIKSLVGQGADGLMLIGNDRPDKTWDFIDKRRVAHVVSWCNVSREGQFFAGFDNATAAGDAAERAMRLGHRRIAVISGQTASNDRAKARRDGVYAAVARFGDGARITHEVEAPYLIDDAAAAFDQIMAQAEKPTVVLCANDALAAGAMMRAREIGMSLPDEMSFVGFDDVGLARVVTPALTTVRVPQIEMGRAAAQFLLAKIAGENDLSSTTFATEFIQRESLKPPRLP